LGIKGTSTRAIWAGYEPVSSMISQIIAQHSSRASDNHEKWSGCKPSAEVLVERLKDALARRSCSTIKRGSRGADADGRRNSWIVESSLRAVAEDHTLLHSSAMA
jgi:hypothetical protein